jgi:hypothetical protein
MQLQKKNFKRQLSKEEKQKKYSQVMPITFWDILDEKSKKTLLQIKNKSNAKN